MEKDVKLSNEFMLSDFAYNPNPEFLQQNMEYAKNTKGIISRLIKTSVRAEEIQVILGKKIHIEKGIICPEVNNMLLDSSPTSWHLSGYAIDFTCEAFGSPYKICMDLMRGYFPFDRLYNEVTHLHCCIHENYRMITRTLLQRGMPFAEGMLPWE